MRVAVPDAPAVDAVTVEIIEAYYVISRGRQYVGMNGAPAPLSIGAINEYLSAYGQRQCRREFDAVVFALDDEFRAAWVEKSKSKDKD